MFFKKRFKPKGKYVGKYKNGKRHGKGSITFSDAHGAYKYVYIGEWKDDKLYGQGKIEFSKDNTKIKYVGEWKDNQFWGQGTLTLQDGTKYIGEFKDGACQGKGTQTSPDGEKYVGEFKDGKFHGQGTLTFPDGSKDVGEFKKGRRFGPGKFTTPGGKVSETGKCSFCGKPGELMTSPWSVPATYTLCRWHFWRLLIWQPPFAPLHALFRLLIIIVIFFIIFSIIIVTIGIISQDGLIDTLISIAPYILGLIIFVLLTFVYERVTKRSWNEDFQKIIYIFVALLLLVIFLEATNVTNIFGGSIYKMHAQTVKYISVETQKCKLGESKFMKSNQSCPATAFKTINGAVATMIDKNPFDKAKLSVRLSSSNTNDEDLGYISLSASGSDIIYIKSCIKTPCRKEENRLFDWIVLNND